MSWECAVVRLIDSIGWIRFDSTDSIDAGLSKVFTDSDMILELSGDGDQPWGAEQYRPPEVKALEPGARTSVAKGDAYVEYR